MTVQAVAGTHAVLLGFDVAEGAHRGLLGFAVEKTVLPSGDPEWLPNFLRFAVNDRPDGPVGSDDNPLQAFQWGDYVVEPGQRLRYRVFAVYGSPGSVQPKGRPATVEVVTEQSDDGRHGVFFNRGVAGSQAYARKFGTQSPLGIPEARSWLSRGLEEGLLDFIRRASGPGVALRGALYEFFHAPVLSALRDAAVRGADVQLVVSDPADGVGWPEAPSWANAEAMRQQRSIRPRRPFLRLARPRRNAEDIAHNKFIVLVEDGKPVAVWTGSTNITPGGIYGHSNVGHLVTDEAVAARYLGYWQQLAADPEPEHMQGWTETDSPLPALNGQAPIVDAGSHAVFSPRRTNAALDRYMELIRAAQQSVFMTAAFGIGRYFEPAFRAKRDIPRYLLLETAGNDMELGRADPNLHITAGAYLGQRGGFRQFVEEHLTGLNTHVRFIHTKYLLIDPLTEHPVVVTGSANFSESSTTDNDENMLVISDDRRVADIYVTEFMRLFTHLQFRAAVGADRSDRRAPDPNEPGISSPRHLDETSEWARPFFGADNPKRRERLLFSGGLV